MKRTPARSAVVVDTPSPLRQNPSHNMRVRLAVVRRFSETFAGVAAERQNLIAYLRVSSEAQDTQLQRDALVAAGCVKFFEDKISSRKAERPGLAAALEYLRSGDTLAVWKLDRLGRSVREVLTLADELYERGIGVRILTGTLAGSYT